MVQILSTLALLALGIAGVESIARSDAALPAWPYGTDPQWRAAAQLPGGAQALSAAEKSATAQLGDPWNPPDRYPNDHPPMPAVVAHGNKAEGVWACALCHHADGFGRPENANLRGLSADYIVAQLVAFKNGDRSSADPRKSNTRVMIATAKGLTRDETIAVAAYYAALRPAKGFERVVESATAPKVWSGSTGAVFALAPPDDGRVPLAHEIVEVPENAIQAGVYNDPHVEYVAYAPIGSIARGKLLVSTGGGKTMACDNCHGAGLSGSEIAPPLAGRSPSYIARQLFDIQQGTRRNAPAMGPVVSQLTPDDVLDIAAYLGSL
jgi:cytochrome c553